MLNRVLEAVLATALTVGMEPTALPTVGMEPTAAMEVELASGPPSPSTALCSNSLKIYKRGTVQ
jgi:hypothetical protein